MANGICSRAGGQRGRQHGVYRVALLSETGMTERLLILMLATAGLMATDSGGMMCLAEPQAGQQTRVTERSSSESE